MFGTFFFGIIFTYLARIWNVLQKFVVDFVSYFKPNIYEQDKLTNMLFTDKIFVQLLM